MAIPIEGGSDEARATLEQLWTSAGCDPAALAQVTLTGSDPSLPTGFKIGAAASATIGAAGLAAAELWRWRTRRAQSVAVSMRAAVAAVRSERYLRVDGREVPDRWNHVSGFYRTSDGRWIQLHCNLPHHRDGVLRVLSCDDTREAVAEAVAARKAQELEDVLAAAGMCAGMVRSREEWRTHAQGLAVATLPLFEIVKIGDARPEPAGQGPRPLAGVRVLDLTRVIAGPVCGRTLAEHGADVMRITAGHLPDLETLVIDNGRGKLSAHLDLRRADDAEQLRTLIRQSDVFCQSYRPESLAARGLSPEEMARLRPGIVYVTLCAYGHAGPWRERRGFETLVQSVSGMALEQGLTDGVGGPKHLPAQVLDQGTGYLAAFGAMVALLRRAVDGGSYLVRVSLAQTGRWVDGLGRVNGQGVPLPGLEDIHDLLQVSESPFGRLRHVAPAARLSETPGYWARPSVPLGTHAPAWPA